MEGGPFATICNLFSKIYFVTIYLSLKKENCTPHLKKLFSKYVVSVIVSEGVNIQGKLGRWVRAEPRRERPQRCLSCRVRSGAADLGRPLPRAHWLWGLPSAWHRLGVGWRDRGSDIFAESQGQQPADWLVLAGQLCGWDSGSG